jgi:hypothetical protein
MAYFSKITRRRFKESYTTSVYVIYSTVVFNNILRCVKNKYRLGESENLLTVRFKNILCPIVEVMRYYSILL